MVNNFYRGNFMKMTKKLIGMVAGLAVAASAFAAPITIKVASVAPARSSWDVQQRQIAKEWAQITNGEVILQFVTSDAIGGESGVVSKLQSVRPGQKAPIGGAIFTSMGLADFAPDCNVMTLCAPFMFRNQEEVNAVLKEFTPTMQKALDDKGYVVLGWFNIGWAYFFTSEPAATPNDLKKLRLAVGGLTAPGLKNAFQASGYKTVDVSSEKFSASIADGTIQGMFTIPMYAYAAQYYKHLDNLSNVPLAPVMVGFIMNKEDWNAIPSKYKPELVKSIKKAEAKFVADQKRMDAEYIKKCSAGGCNVINPDQKVWEKAFMADLPNMYSGPNPVVDKAFYDKIAAFLKNFRGE